MLVAMSIEDALIEAGGEVIGPAGTVDAALDLLRNEKDMDAAVLDMNLNGRSGMPIADALSEGSIPFLVLSGYGRAALEKTHGDTPVLSKPFNNATLIDVLRRLLGA
jgi:CheY-like chemotaxis protein